MTGIGAVSARSAFSAVTRIHSVSGKNFTRKQAVEGGKAIELSAAMEEWKRGDVEVVATATRYGYAPIQMMSVYDLSSKLPVLSWNRSVTTKGIRRLSNQKKDRPTSK